MCGKSDVEEGEKEQCVPLYSCSSMNSKIVGSVKKFLYTLIVHTAKGSADGNSIIGHTKAIDLDVLIYYLIIFCKS